MNQQTPRTLTAAAYGILIASILIFGFFSSIEWGIFIAWPVIVIGFIAWAVLLTLADRYRGSDKKAIYRRNQTIFLVLLLVIIAVTFFSTAGRSLFQF